MVRVKDPKASLDFYCNVLGFKLLMYKELPQWKFNVYFVAPVDASTIPEEEEKRWAMCMNTPGCLELTWNYGSETEEGLVYNTGNADATGTCESNCMLRSIWTRSPPICNFHFQAFCCWSQLSRQLFNTITLLQCR